MIQDVGGQRRSNPPMACLKLLTLALKILQAILHRLRLIRPSKSNGCSQILQIITPFNNACCPLTLCLSSTKRSFFLGFFFFVFFLGQMHCSLRASWFRWFTTCTVYIYCHHHFLKVQLFQIARTELICEDKWKFSTFCYYYFFCIKWKYDI